MCLEAACHCEEYKEKEMRMLQDEFEQRKWQKELLSLWIEQLQKQLGWGERKRVEDKLEFMIWYIGSYKDPLVNCIPRRLGWKYVKGDPDWECRDESSEENELDEL